MTVVKSDGLKVVCVSQVENRRKMRSILTGMSLRGI